MDNIRPDIRPDIRLDIRPDIRPDIWPDIQLDIRRVLIFIGFSCFLGCAGFVNAARTQRERSAGAGAAPPLWDSFNL